MPELQNPPVAAPESALVPGMSAPEPHDSIATLAGPTTGGFPNITDSSAPGLEQTQVPGAWVYDFDPGTGVARATFNGEVSFTSGGSATAGVTSFNTRTGAVTLTLADVTGAGGAPLASPTFTGTPTVPGYLPLSGGTLTGSVNGPVFQVTQSGSNGYYLSDRTTANNWSLTSSAGSFHLYRDATLNLTLDGAGNATFTGTVTSQGFTNGSNAAAGQVGEYNATTAGPTAITSNVLAAIVQLTLAAGDWDVWGYMQISPSTATVGNMYAGVSLSNSNFGNFPSETSTAGNNFGATAQALTGFRVSSASATTIYGVVQATFGGTCTATGSLFARRVR